MLIVLILLIKVILSNHLTKNHTVIGIYTHTPNNKTTILPNGTQVTHVSHLSLIPVSCVKFIQMSGARVIPIFAFKDQQYFDQILPKINGVVFTGGSTPLNINDKWTSNSEYIMKYAMNQTKRGNPFPIWGVCRGIQQMVFFTAGYDHESIGKVQGEIDVMNTLQIQPNNTLFKDLPQYLLNSLQYGKGIMFFHHIWAIRRDYYNKSEALQKFWNVESYTTSSANQQYLSAIKAREYPFFGLQFHPQKVQFEWKVISDKSQHPVEVSQILSNNFIQIARKNTNRMASNQQLIRLSIFNYQKHKSTSDYMEVYYFNEQHIPNDLFDHNKIHLTKK